MSIFRLTACKTLVLLSLISVVGFSQSGRMMGVLPFHNEGNSRNDWVSRGIDEVLYNKLSEINSLSVYERETFRRILKSADVDVSNGVDARKAFSVGKSTGIEVLITGKYKVESDNLSLTFQMISTYTGASIYDETFTGPLSDIFLFLQKGIQKGIDIMQVSISPEEMRVLERKPTSSMKAFEAYCKALQEIDNDSPMETTAGYLNRAVQEDPNFWEAQYLLGTVYYDFDFYDRALEQFDNVIRSNSSFYKAYYGKGVIYYQNKQFTKALDEFKRTLEFNRDHDRSYYYMGMLYTRIDSLKKGIDYLTRSIELNPNYAPAYFQLGRSEMKRGWFKNALTSLSKSTALDPDYYLAHNALGESYYSLNSFEEAILEFNKAIALKPDFATAYFNLGNAIYRRGALAEIVDAFWALLEVQNVPEGSNGSLESPLEGLEDLREKSRIENPDKVLHSMIGAYRTALEYDKSFYEASYNLALSYENMGNLDSTEYFYKLAIEQNPDLSQAHMRLGKLYDSQARYDLALQEYKKVVEIEPDYFAANPKLGEPYRYVDVIETVLNEHMDTLKRNPNDKDALEVVGKIYVSLGRLGQAEEYYQQLVDLSPNDIIAQQTLREIRRKLRKL
jgi:tetratricopeptide (TPR) repeat protein/TolB-like protein